MMLKATLSAISVVSLASTTPQRAEAYPVDCAILICLSGGWAYPSAECTVAQIEFMRRVTPWPIEPPIQIWNCPLKASLQQDADTSPMQRLYDITFPEGPTPVQDTPSLPTIPIAYADDHAAETNRLLRLIGDNFGEISEDNGTADVDISGPTFNFLRSIKVWDIRYKIKRTDHGYCYETGVSNLGSYGTQGDFQWEDVTFDDAPSWSIANRSCPNKGKDRQHRGVGIEWTDYSGIHGHDFITY